MGIPEEMFEIIISRNFPKFMTDNQTTNPESSGNTKHRIKNNIT